MKMTHKAVVAEVHNNNSNNNNNNNTSRTDRADTYPPNHMDLRMSWRLGRGGQK